MPCAKHGLSSDSSEGWAADMHRYFVGYVIHRNAHAIWGPQWERDSIILDLADPIVHTSDLRELEASLTKKNDGRDVRLTTLQLITA
jgi:hypothetical protein